MPQRPAHLPYYLHALPIPFVARWERFPLPVSFVAEGGVMAASKRVTMKGSGSEKPVSFSRGGLHRSLGVPEGERIPAAKLAAAKAGRYGPKAKKQATMASGMLAAGRRTAAKRGR